ncbi:hypothetical protein L6452_15147 [Arctium lappa]|uniref:Uncharacterized protein n=1 Tax=Arctium lappa TaxID=4217 RepID=A0ACB9CMZ0_ARCLA|nr:hypothetical protein L6452_15147 [Arctium lappa]
MYHLSSSSLKNLFTTGEPISILSVVLMVAVSSMGKMSVSEKIWKKDENERGVGMCTRDSYDDDDDSPDEVEVVADDE